MANSIEDWEEKKAQEDLTNLPHFWTRIGTDCVHSYFISIGRRKRLGIELNRIDEDEREKMKLQLKLVVIVWVN